MMLNATPLCPHFGPCGGCQLQDHAYPAQLALKQQRLAALLLAAEISGLPPIEVHSGEPWHYRNRIRLRVNAEPDGSFHVGYNQHASNVFLSVATCPISAPLLLRAALALCKLAKASSGIAQWLAVTAEIELFTTRDESRLQLTLLLRDTPNLASAQLARSFAALCHALQREVPEMSGAGAELLRSTRANAMKAAASRRMAASFTAPAWGSSGLLYDVTLNGDAQQLWVGRGSFFQVNRYLVEELVAVATGNVASTRGALAWDLFAGVGLFTRALAPFFERIVSVETASAATADLASVRLPNASIHTGTVLDFLRLAALDRERPSLVLLDPPRAGRGLDAATLLARLRPARIVYVSCEPVTLARDLRAMLFSGYNLAELHLVDMFPQTSHMETVAIFDCMDDQRQHRRG